MGHSLSLALVEIERWRQSTSQIKFEEALHLIEMVRASADDLQKHSEPTSKNRITKTQFEAEV